MSARSSIIIFFFNDTATTEIYTLPYTTLFRSAGHERERVPSVPVPRDGRHGASLGRHATPAMTCSVRRALGDARAVRRMVERPSGRPRFKRGFSKRLGLHDLSFTSGRSA